MKILLYYNFCCQLYTSIFKLLYFAGKVRKYKETSDKFLSFVGHLDRRVYLDENIKHGDARYNPMLSAMAAKLAYENEAMVGTTVRQYWKVN